MRVSGNSERQGVATSSGRRMGKKKPALRNKSRHYAFSNLVRVSGKQPPLWGGVRGDTAPLLMFLMRLHFVQDFRTF